MRCDSSELARHGIGAGPAEREEMLSLLHDPWTWVRLCLALRTPFALRSSDCLACRGLSDSFGSVCVRNAALCSHVNVMRERRASFAMRVVALAIAERVVTDLTIRLESADGARPGGRYGRRAKACRPGDPRGSSSPFTPQSAAQLALGRG